MASFEGIHFKGTARYEVERHLGSGSSGAVYSAFDHERGVRVALKTLYQSEPDALYRFKREFRALAGLSHPNLVQLHELTNEGRLWFFTMDLISGTDFISWVRANAGFAAIEARLRAAAPQLAQGIAALHAAGKLHRDIKPSNVLVTPDGRVVILDFGLVTESTSQQTFESMTESVLGTPGYMAPEQGSGSRLSEATDWYCVGTLIYEALTGRTPFIGQFVRVMLDKQSREPDPPRTVVPDVPDDLDRLCSGLLRRDPDDRLSGADVLLCLGVEDEDPGAAPPAAPDPALLCGRDALLAELWDAYAAVRRETATVVWVHGLSGLGKSALVQHFLGQVREREPSTVILHGRCYENETVPYKALDSLIDQLTRYLRSLEFADAAALVPSDILVLTRLFPVLRRVDAVALARRKVLAIPDSQELRRRAFATLREMFTRIAENAPLVLFIDDLQWGDADSALLLSEALGPPDPPPLLLIGAYRDEDAPSSSLIRALRRPDSPTALTGRDLEVGELSPEASRELTLQILGRRTTWTERLAAVVAREARGNPMFISELLVHTPAELGTGDDALPVASLDEVLRLRIAALPVEGRRLLEILAVASRPIEIETARRASELRREEQATFGLLRSHQLIRGTGSRDHDLVETFNNSIRRSILGGLSPVELAVHHLRLARALEVSGRADPELLAIHLSKAGVVDEAAEYAVAAADKATEALAFERAARLFRWALELDPGDPDRARELRQRLGEALVKAGRGAEAADVFRQVAMGAPAAEALEMRRRSAEQWLISGHVDQGIEALREVLEAVGLHLPTSKWRALLELVVWRLWLALRGLDFAERDRTQVSAEVLSRIDVCWSAAVGLGWVDTVFGAAFQARHLLLALRTGEPDRVIRALALEVVYRAGLGRPTEALVRKARELSEQRPNPHHQGLVELTAGVAAFYEGRWSSALGSLREAGKLLHERSAGVTWELDSADFFTLRCLASLGEINELRHRLPATLKDAQERGDLYLSTNLRTRLAWFVHLADDAPERAVDDLRTAIDAWSQEGFHVQHYWHSLGRIEVALYAGEAAVADEILGEHLPRIEKARLLRIPDPAIEVNFLRGRVALALATAEASDRAAALARAERAAAATSRAVKSERGKPMARLLRAALDVARGRNDRALEHLTSAEAAFLASDMALHAAVARRRLGQLRGDAALVRAAEASLLELGIRNPEKMADSLAPGPWPSGP